MAINSILLSELTDGTVEGEGIFDVLMKSGKAHLDQEWQKQRINGPEYSTVYLGMMTSILQQAIAFISTQKQSELLDAQNDLALVQKDKVNKEIEVLADQQLLIQAQENLAKEQLLKVTEEIALLGQKLLTEQAQITDTVDGSVVAGIIGKKKDLYTQQKESFERDAEQTLAKHMIDTWNVRRTTDEYGTGFTAAGLSNEEINKVLNKAKDGLGIAEYTPTTTAEFTYQALGAGQIQLTNLSFATPGKTIDAMLWEYGDGGTSQDTEDHVHQYPNATATYTARLTIWDSDNVQSLMERVINITEF